MVSLIHTSDLHIGEDGNKAERLAGLIRVVDLVLDTGADVLLIAGDLFDSARVPRSDVEDSLGQLARLGVSVCIIPGNHDALEPPSIYDRVDPREAGLHVHLLSDPDGQDVVLEHLSLRIWARGMLAHTPSNTPLAGYRPFEDARWNVVMAHGHFVTTREDVSRSSPIFRTDIENLDCQYLALGHWHQYADVSTASTPAFYSGSTVNQFAEFASVNLIRLSENAATEVLRIPLR
jgi:DNA repair exonuclease SbcCD nuclease subunit